MILKQLGIVVIGRNEGDRLVRCFLSMGPKVCDVVYVDSGSVDDSTLKAEQFGAIIVNLEASSRFTAGRARNSGFAALKVANPTIEFVQFVDGDCELDQAWLDAALAFLEQRKDVAVVCGRRRERFPEKSVYNQLSDIEWSTPCGEVSSCGGDSLVRTEAFEKVGGFRPEILAGEEPELCARLQMQGWKIWRLDAEMTRHDMDMSRFGQWWRRMVRSGYGYAEVSRLLRRSTHRTFDVEVKRAVFWGMVLPIVVIGGMIVHPAACVMLVAYPIQLSRIALRSRDKEINPLAYASLLMIAKFAEAQGILKYYWSVVVRRDSAPKEYKRA